MGDFCWVSGFLRQIENGNAVSDTPGGLRPTGGGKPGGLGCGSLKVTVRMLKSTRKPNSSLQVTCSSFTGC